MNAPKPAGLQLLCTLVRRCSTVHHLQQIHGQFVILALNHDTCLLSQLICAYCQFQQVQYAFTIYDRAPNPSIYLFNTILDVFRRTPSIHCVTPNFYRFHMRINPAAGPDCFTFPPLLCATTASVSSLKLNEEIHTHIVKFGAWTDVYVSTALLDSYGKVGSVESARKVFEDMPARNVVTCNSLLSVLGKCGDVDQARRVFFRMRDWNVVSWTSMIQVYVENGCYSDALTLFREMEVGDLKPNEFTLASVLVASANLGSLELGRTIHSMLERRGFRCDLFVVSALIELYMKCGQVTDALQLFDEMPQKNVVMYSTMIVGLAINGRGLAAIEAFEHMKSAEILPNDVTFVGVLSACGHSGLVDRGKHYFKSLSKDYNVMPALPHYACMVDLLGRAGLLGEAYRFIMYMPVKPDVVVWGALLATCRIHQKWKFGKYVAQKILELEPRHSGTFIFLSHLYDRAGDADSVKNVKRAMGSKGIKKNPGNSWIEVNGNVYRFYAGDTSHPQTELIYSKLDDLYKLLEVEGYLPEKCSLVYDIEDEDREHALQVHSEKLAVAFGLLSTPAWRCLRIVKNLRICDDCHLVIKFVSKFENRGIIVRDSNRFHHFTGGTCSCQDYW